MKKLNYIIIGILLLIIIGLIVALIIIPKEKKVIEYKKCIINNDEEKFNKKEYDLKQLYFNNLKINDSDKDKGLILDSEYFEKDNVFIKSEDGKITDLYLSLDKDNKITYKNNNLTDLEDFIEAFGQYDKKITYYNEDRYDFIYIQSDESPNLSEYELTIRYKNNKIISVELVKNDIKMMG